MNKPKQNLSWISPYLKALALILMLIAPLIYIYSYENQYLNIIDHTEISDRVNKVLAKTSEQRVTLERKLQRSLNQAFQSLNTRNYTWQQQTRLMFSRRVKENSWPLPLTNHRHIQILSILLIQNQLQSLQSVKKMIIKGLQWFNDKYLLNMSLIVWHQGLKFSQIPKNTLIINFRIFRYEFVEQNIASRLRRGQHRNQYYIGEIVTQLRSTSLFYHCRYTHQACSLTTFLFLSPLIKQHSYINAQQELYLFDQVHRNTLFNALAQYLGVKQLEMMEDMGGKGNSLIDIYHQARQLSYLQGTVQALTYISFTFKPEVDDLWGQLSRLWKQSPQKAYHYLLDGKHISPYIHNPQEFQIINQLLDYIDDQGEQLGVAVLGDWRVGHIDLFPNNFKAGVYLPLIIIFLYPVFIKLKDLVAYLFGFVGKKATEDKKQQKQD